MKEVESALPQKKEINYVRALDKNGNPILINKEDLAQVVGELIGIVSLEKIGLANKNNVRFELSRPETDTWFHLAMCNGGKIELISAASLVGAPGYLYYISLVSHKSASSPYGKVYSFGSQSVDFKLYSKKEENVIHYYLNITRNWLSLSFLPIFIGKNATILAENADTPNFEELTEIPLESSIVR